MKLFTFTILLFSTTAYSQWEALNTFNENTPLYSVFFTDDEHGWIAGAEGTILKFNSLRFKWEPQLKIATTDLLSIGFFDNSTGITCGSNGTLLRSTDGGSAWTIRQTGFSNNLNDIYILNESTAYLAGNSGLLLKTTDKGLNWSSITVPTLSALKSVHFLNPDLGFAGTDSTKVLKTTNGGLTWSTTFFPGYSELLNVNAISFVNSSTGYIGGGFGLGDFGISFLYKTTDGGASWVDQNSTSYNIHDLKFRDSETGVIVGGQDSWNRFLGVKTNSAFNTLIFHSEDYDIFSCHITPTGKGWAAGGAGAIFYTDDYRSNWSQIYSGSSDIPSALSSSSDNELYIGLVRFNFREPADVVMKGFNNKRLFKDVSRYMDNTGSGEHMISLSVPDSTYGFYNTNFDVAMTSNGGYTWEYSLHPSGGGGLLFLNRDTGWLYSEKIYKTNNRASTWTVQFEPSSPLNFTSMSFVNSQVGYACGSDDSLIGKVLKTTNGGSTWSYLNIPAVGHLTSVSFSNPDTGLAAGWGSTLLRTTNGGSTWTNINSGNYTIVETTSNKPVKIKNDKRVIGINRPSQDLYKEIKVTSAGNYLDAEFYKNAVFIASDDGTVLRSFDYANTWISDIIGNPVLEVEFDEYQYALARTTDNVYLNKLANPVPVEMISFSASVQMGIAVLEWTTISEMNNRGFEIQKRTGDDWIVIGFIPGMGSSTKITNYTFEDNDLVPGRLTYYRLRQIDLSGESQYSSEAEILLNILSYSLEQNYPNPFNPVTVIKYQIPASEFVTIRLIDAIGREVKLLENSFMEAGLHEININSADLSLSSGVYFYSITAGEFSSVKKMMVLK